MRNYQQCSRCIMDTTDPEISFNIQGVCNHCITYDIKASEELLSQEERESRLNQVVTTMKNAGKGKPYDCIIGVSGGVDSTYVAYLVKKLGLRPLAIHLDNGWNAELAVHNIEKLLKILDIDLHTHVINWEEFKDLQLSFFKSSVPNLEIPTDHAISAILYKLASKYGISYIITGSNISTEAVMPASWMGGNQIQSYALIKNIHRKFGSKPLKTFPAMGLFCFVWHTFVKKKKLINILNFIDYNIDKAKHLIQEELGWVDHRYKHFESIFTRFFQGYILLKKFNMDKRLPHFSSLILSGQMTRDEALKALRKSVYDDTRLQEDKEFLLKKWGLKQEMFDHYMAMPPKTYKEYGDMSWLFDNAKPLFRLVRKYILSI